MTDAEILEMIRAADRADALSSEFAGQFTNIWAARLSVHPGSPTFEWYQDVSIALDRLYRVVWPTYVQYQTASLFLQDNPAEPFGRKPTRMDRYRQWWQIRQAMFRLDRACWRVNNRWERLVELKEKESADQATA